MLSFLTVYINISIEELSWVFTVRGGGVILGALFSSLLCYKRPDWKDLWMTSALLLLAFSSAAAPWCSNIFYLFAVFLVSGTAKGMIVLGMVSYKRYMTTW